MVSGFLTSPWDQLRIFSGAGQTDTDRDVVERVLGLLEEVVDVLHGDS